MKLVYLDINNKKTKLYDASLLSQIVGFWLSIPDVMRIYIIVIILVAITSIISLLVVVSKEKIYPESNKNSKNGIIMGKRHLPRTAPFSNIARPKVIYNQGAGGASVDG